LSILVLLLSTGAALAAGNELVLQQSAEGGLVQVPAEPEYQLSPAMPAATASTDRGLPPKRYGGQTFLVDILALATAGAGFLSANVTSGNPSGPGIALLVLGSATYLLGSPIVHGLHRNGGRAAGSLGMRVGFPLLGGLIGATLFRSRSGGDTGAIEGLVAFGVGGAIGLVPPIAIDALVLAREPASRQDAQPNKVQVGIVPSRSAPGASVVLVPPAESSYRFEYRDPRRIEAGK